MHAYISFGLLIYSFLIKVALSIIFFISIIYKITKINIFKLLIRKS